MRGRETPAVAVRRLEQLRDRAALSIGYRNPRAIVRQRRQLRVDRAVARRVRWPRVVFVAALPKSGSTWLERMLCEIPGYGVRAFVDPDACTLDHDVCDDVFASLPDDLLAVLKMHVNPREANLEVIERHVSKVVVLHRDVRDVAVSRYFHVCADPAHADHVLYRTSTKDEGLGHSIEVVLDEYVPWVTGWLERVADDAQGRFLELRYRDLRANPAEALLEVTRHVGVPMSEDEADRAAADVTAATRPSDTPTRRGLQASFRRGHTARKGVVGDWSTHFTPEHVELFAERAGDMLVATGYEPDLAWAEVASSAG